jgi:8-oxo-dGTP diphosphatase
VKVVAALIAHSVDPHRFLVQQRAEGQSQPLLWEFPGGKVESGESDEVALARECREELGIELEVGPRMASAVHQYPEIRVELVLYRSKVSSGGDPQCLGAKQLRFATVAEMRSLPFCEADLPLIEGLAS